MHGRDRLSVLDGEQGDDTGAIDPVLVKSLQVCLKAGSTGRVRTGNGHRDRAGHGIA